MLRKAWQDLSVLDTTHTLSSLESQPGQTLQPQVSGECPGTVPSQAPTHLSLTHTGNSEELTHTHIHSEASQAAPSWKEVLPQTLRNRVPLGRLVALGFPEQRSKFGRNTN